MSLRYCEQHQAWDYLGWPDATSADGWAHIRWLGTTWACGHSSDDYIGSPDERDAAHKRAHRFDLIAPAVLGVATLLLIVVIGLHR